MLFVKKCIAKIINAIIEHSSISMLEVVFISLPFQFLKTKPLVFDSISRSSYEQKRFGNVNIYNRD